MTRLRVREPDTLTRVTEYVPEIVEFVEGIVRNGYGYEAEGSVYFDTLAFDRSPNHTYAKLEPWSKGNRDLLEDGEGECNNSTTVSLIYHSTLQARYLTRQVVDRLQILRSGKHQNPGSLLGSPHGGLADLDGILSAQSWPVQSSVVRWIFIRVGLISLFLTMIMKLHNLRLVLI